jgi:phenylpropionate dioxygenase-like ring-hydroxylating dioxygenase large terminal subunit
MASPADPTTVAGGNPVRIMCTMALTPTAAPITQPEPTEFLDDPALAERLLTHIENGTTDLASGSWQEPAENYRDPYRFDREIDLLRRLPIPFCPTAALSKPGSYLALEAAGRPLVAIRDRSGVVRVFKNACRHRGTAVADGCGQAGSMVCPYHGWVYHLDGRLRHIPHREGFAILDGDDIGLVEVPSVEVGGFVVVDQEGGSDLSLLEFPLTPVLATPVFVGQSVSTVEANWKVFVESFLEGYHIKSTHRETFFPFGYDNTNVVEHVGPHTRVTFPFRRIEKLRERPATERGLGGSVTRAVNLYPNVIVAELSHHTTVAILEPIDVSTTKMTSFQLVAAEAVDTAVDSGVSAAATRDLQFVQDGVREDQAMVRAVQRGLDSDVSGHFTFGLYEGGLTHFHENLSDGLRDLTT